MTRVSLSPTVHHPLTSSTSADCRRLVVVRGTTAAACHLAERRPSVRLSVCRLVVVRGTTAAACHLAERRPSVRLSVCRLVVVRGTMAAACHLAERRPSVRLSPSTATQFKVHSFLAAYRFILYRIDCNAVGRSYVGGSPFITQIITCLFVKLERLVSAVSHYVN